MKLLSPAKINIFLDILGKLDNGYHSLFMVMQTVGLYDEISAEKRNDGKIVIHCDTEGVPCDNRNTAYKAAEYFFEETGIKSGVTIEIVKNIPHEAGLAGGSTDAAGVLKLLNALYETSLSETKLCEIGLRVGSDVPFCIVGGTCLCQNTGGVISRLKDLKKCFVVLAKPETGVSTPEAYKAADKAYIYHPDCLKMLDCCEKGDFKGICKNAGNVFEQVVEVPERVEIKKIMSDNNCSLCQMSGSGPTVFGLFENKEDAEKSAEIIKKICPKTFICETVNG